ncbi:hypothetical protein LNO81_10760 [Klebsiella variicola subsp. variicola]|nr:hypothetical protein [Klebsiella variicola subsp. variicola]
MSPIFILDNTSAPARYGITASLWANRLGLPLWSLRPTSPAMFPTAISTSFVPGTA